MGSRTIAAYNPTLTNYAMGLSQDLMGVAANFLAPVVVVPAGLGRYKSYDTKNAFISYPTERALGGGATRIAFSATDPTYDCRPQALEVAIDDSEYEAAGDAQSGALEQSRIKTLISSAALAHEDKVATVAKTLTAVSAVGVWSSASNDPIAEIDAQIESITSATGQMPNRIVFGLGAWRVARNHAKVTARMPANSVVGTTINQFAAMLMNPAIDIRVGLLAKDSTKLGGTKSSSNIIGSDIFIFIGNDSPSEYDASFMKTFMTKAGAVESVRTYRDEGARSLVHAIDWSEDIQITGTTCARRITLS